MSAPDTDLNKQVRRHRGPIYGITLGLIFVAIVTIGAFVWPGIPLDRQAAADGAATETVDDQAVTGGPSIIVDNEANVIAEETQ